MTTERQRSFEKYYPNLKKLHTMTQNQQQDLLIEWDLYQPQQQNAILSEFRRRFRGNYSKNDLFEFLKQKLEIEGYWEKIGLV